jgi:hypothetical protein
VSEERFAPEVSAALRETGAEPRPIKAIEQTDLTGLSLMTLVAEMNTAPRVDVLGVFPRVLGEALLATEATDLTPPSGPRSLTYFTPDRERVLAYRHEDHLGPVIQRWNTGLVCFRNWSARLGGASAAGGGEVLVFDDLSLDCIVVCRPETGPPRIILLNFLPQAGVPSAPQRVPQESLILTEVRETVDPVLARVETLREASAPLVARRLVCVHSGDGGGGRAGVGRGAGGLPEEFEPVLKDLRPYVSPREPTDAIPIAVVALYAESFHGPGVLLKHRTVSNSPDDFETLSLLSEQVMEQDLALAVDAPLPRDCVDDEMLDHWWKAVGNPERIEIPHEAFVAAAQREVFLASGLDIARDRFTYCGSHLLEREDHGGQLGFFAFRVVLRRDHQVDELRRALEWDDDLRFVLASTLYPPDRVAGDPPAGDPRRPRLNRLLRRRPEWVSSVLLTVREEDAGDGA